jgi:hypothetical protein
MKTLPTDFRFSQGENEEIRIPTALREYESNAINYKATKAFTFIAHINNHYYLFFLHNGESFQNIQDILNNGCTPHTTGGEGHSFQGAGLCYSACAINNIGELIIASKINGTFLIGRGFGSLEDNFWRIEDVTTSWTPVLNQIVGKYNLDQYNVIYMSKITLSEQNEAHSHLQPKIMNLLGFLRPKVNDNNLTVHYCEKVIGHHDYLTQLNKKGESQKDYMCLSNVRNGEKNTGSTNRRAIAYDSYINRFCEKSYEIDVPSFQFDVSGSDRITRVFVKSAKIKIDLFPATKSEGKGNWLANVRDGDGDRAKGNDFKIGKVSEYGAVPKRKAFLLMPWVSTWVTNNYPKNAQHYGRFSTNVIGVVAQPTDLMASLNLPFYQKRGGAFVTVFVSVEEIEKVQYITKNNGNEQIVETLTAAPQIILQLLMRRPDFMFANTPAIKELMISAANAAAPNVSDELKKKCMEFFPPIESRLVPLLEGGADATRTSKKHAKTRQSNVAIYDAETGEDFNKMFQPGTTKRLAVWHVTEERFLTVENLTVLSESRGVTIKQSEDWASPKGNASTIEVEVEILCRIDEKGIIREIKKEDYVFGESLPSRNVRLGYGIERVNLGIVKGVPKCKTNSKTPPERKGNTKTKKGNNGYLWRESPDIICSVRLTEILLNPNYPAVASFCSSDAKEDSKQVQIIKEIYDIISTNCKAYLQTEKTLGLTAQVAAPEPYEDMTDYAVNKIAAATLASTMVANLIVVLTGYETKETTKD